MLTSNIPENLLRPGIIDSAVIALVGYAVVFVGLIALMAVLAILGGYFAAKDAKKATPAATLAANPVPESPKAVAPGSAGQLKLHDVEPKTAAMLMAIIADKLGKPLNELRFLSIKEVK